MGLFVLVIFFLRNRAGCAPLNAQCPHLPQAESGYGGLHAANRWGTELDALKVGHALCNRPTSYLSRDHSQERAIGVAGGTDERGSVRLTGDGKWEISGMFGGFECGIVGRWGLGWCQ